MPALTWSGDWLDWDKGNPEMAGVNAGKLGLSADGDTAAAKTLSVLILHSSCLHEGFYCCEGTHDQKQAGEESVYLADTSTL